jgi:DHA1 family tetracycline resistance protein-like MFS transporter
MYAIAVGTLAEVIPEKTAFGLGFVVGPPVGGWLGMQKPRLPFRVAGALSLANAFWGLFVLPESLPKEKRRSRLDLSTANPLGTLALLRRHRELLGLACVNFLGWVAHEVYPVIFVLYAGYRPASQALMSRRVSASEQGELQGALGSVRSVAMLVAPSIFSLTFAFAIAAERPVKTPGAPWFVAAALLVAAAALAAAVTRVPEAPSEERESGRIS